MASWNCEAGKAMIDQCATRNRLVTIVMYHYVRDLKQSRFPAIKGLSVDGFRRQLDYIQSRYTPITVDQMLSALGAGATDLPPNAILLTFDDGYSDHFYNVFPILDARRIQGCFFPPAQAIQQHKVLDVNKIQFILATVPDVAWLLDQVFSSLEEFRHAYPVRKKEEYLLAISGKHRYDTPEVTIFKRLLQRELPEAVRTEIVRRLFTRHVSADEAAFACELYMSADQIACLHRRGMHVGSHGFSHVWLDHVSPESQAIEIDRSREFLRTLGIEGEEWSICYPYGGFNGSLIEILRVRQCSLGFTAEARIADLTVDDRLTLPRVDTNDLPS